MVATLSVDLQLSRLQAYAVAGLTVKPTKVGVNYFSQRNNYTQPHRTCNSSSNAMYADWLLRVTGRKPLSGDDEYLRQVLKIGDSPDHGVQTRVIQLYGFTTRWRTGGNISNVDALLAAGFPVVVNILHRGTLRNPTGGHVICLIDGKPGESYTAHDPYGTLSSGYSNPAGAYSRIDWSEFRVRWQGGYRTL